MVFTSRTCYTCQTLIKLQFSQRILKNTNIKFLEKISSGSGRTDRHIPEGANSERNGTRSNKNSARFCHKSTSVFMSHTRYACQVLIKLEYSQEFKKKPLISFFTKNHPEGADGQRDGHILVPDNANRERNGK